MAVLPSRPGSARFGRERLAVESSHTPGELGALPADPEAAGTTGVDGTPFAAVGAPAFRAPALGARALMVGPAGRYLARRNYYCPWHRLGAEVTPELWGVMGVPRGSRALAPHRVRTAGSAAAVL